MGTTFVRIGECGFWMNDSVLELWLRLLALHVEDPVSPGSRAATIRDQWLFASRGYCNGCVPVRLDEALSAPEGERLVRAAIRSLLAALSTAPSHIDKDALNLMGFSGEFTADVDTRRLAEVGKAWLDLLDGKITSRAEDASFMPGSK
jgi:hypothetical protein